MKDQTRHTLKQLISGGISPKEAARRLRQGGGTTDIVLAIRTADGLYTIEDETGLTREQMRARLAGSTYIELDEDDAKLASGPPVLLPGKDGTVFILPNNRR